MNDYEKMQQLYEEGVGQAPFPYNNVGGDLRGLRTSNRGNMQYHQSPPGSGNSINRTSRKLTYGKDEIPTVSPGATGKMLTRRIPHAGDEEEATLSVAEVRNAIVQELEDANPDCTFALDALAKKLGIKIEYPS